MEGGEGGRERRPHPSSPLSWDSSSCPGHLPLQKCQGRIKPLSVPSHLLQLTGYMPCLPRLHSQQCLQVYPQASQQLNLLSFGDCSQSPPTDSGPPVFLSPRATLHSSQEAPTQHCPANCLLPLNPAPSPPPQSGSHLTSLDKPSRIAPPRLQLIAILGKTRGVLSWVFLC